MEARQIKYILNTKGFKSDEWTTLSKGTENGIGMIALYSDSSFYVEPSSTQFYFDTDEGNLYIKKYCGVGRKEKDSLRIIPVVFKGETYYFMPAPNQFNDPTIGHFSTCVSFDHICGIYDKNHSSYFNKI